MNILSWLLFHDTNVEREKKTLQAQLTTSVMQFERRRGEVAQIADDVMKVMHRRSGNVEKH